MVLKDKGVSDTTMLKIIAKVLKDHSASIKGFKLKVSGEVVTVTPEDMIQFAEGLKEELSQGDYVKICRCSTCGNFNYPGKKGERGWCMPKETTSFRKTTDYCSGWTPMTEQQANTRRKINEYFGTSKGG